MIDPALIQSVIRVLFAVVIITAAYIISTRNLSTLVSAYAFQSLTLVFMALALWSLEDAPILLAIAIITFISKVLIIPYFITTIQERIRIKRDIEFHFLSPTTSLLLSMGLILFIYIALSNILKDTAARESLFFFGAVIGLSLMLMGMMVTFSRKRAITKVLGYLSMENGVLLFGMFVTELPFIIEFLIVIDLIILVMLTTILSVGLDSTLEEYHDRLHRFHLVEDTEEGS
ncbi:hydrogenase subunit [Methanoregula sp.]|uniref:hydrogenase subunit n=1 Tax=Methanoregula sp. TaxID=2052170 RepID=UPI00237106B0|nr:hydrogenase subunit [Methanoregula sp.]MDD1687622.1 hydrogenase subunit [Methanoregula sp.]